MHLEKSRFMMLHEETNAGKIAALDAIQDAYTPYVKDCADQMIDQHVFKMPRSAKQEFFPKAEHLTSQIAKNAQDHAIAIVSGWTASAYETKVKKTITKLKNEGWIGEP